MFDAERQVIGAVVVYRDITAQVQAEGRNEELLIELEASEAKFRALINHIDSAVIMRDSAKVLYTNERYRELFVDPA